MTREEPTSLLVARWALLGGFLVALASFDQTPNELGVFEFEPEFDPELGPMFGQLAVLPPRLWGAGAGFEPDESDPEELGAVVDGPLLFEELSVCAYATAAPLPSMIPARAHPATACLSRMVMLFTSLRRRSSSIMNDEPGTTL